MGRLRWVSWVSAGQIRGVRWVTGVTAPPTVITENNYLQGDTLLMNFVSKKQFARLPRHKLNLVGGGDKLWV